MFRYDGKAGKEIAVQNLKKWQAIRDLLVTVNESAIWNL